MSKGKTSKTMVWILMAMLILGLGGFGVTNLSGAVRTIGDVGGKEISINDYARALQDELRAIEAQTGQPMSFAQGQALGLDRAVLGQLVVRRAMDAENTRLGISIGDENLRRELISIPAFQGLDGGFDREAYAFAIDQAGMNESDFEDSVREETARSLLQGAVVSGIAMPAAYADTVIGYVAEQRDFTWTRLSEDNLTREIPEPTEDQISAYYEANIDDFMVPATRQITYAWLSPEMIIDSVEVDEEALRALYDERNDEFNRPERRLVERLVFPNMEAAEVARKQLDNGQTTFEALVKSRGLELSDIDMGDVSMAELGQAGAAVFEVPTGAIAGPVQSDLGPALFRTNGILPAQSTSFEDARADLREELAAERARRVIDAQIGDIDDLLAAGATLEELAKETEMQTGTLDWHETVEHPIAGYEAFRAVVGVVTKDDFPQIEVLEDGGIFALRLDGETEAHPAPLDEVREEAAAAWRAAEVATALNALVETLMPRLEEGTDFTSFGFNAIEETGQDRSAFVPGTPQGFMQTVFDMAPGEIRTMPDGAGLTLVRLNAINAPSTGAPEIAAVAGSITQQVSAGIAQDIFDAYANSLQSAYPVNLNQQALNAVHSQLQ
ncbi:peptidyl-prolyl cis-trans isomerase [Shimia aestuarii]|uniref:Parvulin-like PPIase n=1 Tax=Shimia aestuarii TaxID=254406 RepID=A0A1I4PAY3_9RHOB|nr:peptidyl-prolyl cis-trans isomerase [Shimia aestuarii]SFM25024.1 peptidyl-prolyl cis-trans isomerase D [Shimia aestuarii]